MLKRDDMIMIEWSWKKNIIEWQNLEVYMVVKEIWNSFCDCTMLNFDIDVLKLKLKLKLKYY